MNNETKLCSFLIERLIGFSRAKGLVEELDIHVVRNSLMELFEVDVPYSSETSDISELNKAILNDFEEDSPAGILEPLIGIGAKMGLIPMNTVTNRDLLSAKIMGLLMPRQSEVSRKFYEIYDEAGPAGATDYFYNLSKASNYIRMDRIKKNWVWVSPTKSGYLEISIDMAKPEKDPKETENQKTLQDSGYPKCLICAENVGFKGNLNHPAGQNLRIIPYIVQGENWYLQFLPYSHYEEQSIIFYEKHLPMKISELTFVRLLDFVAAFPDYFIGSNAELPIVGESDLSHEHYQAGKHIFPLDLAHVEKEFTCMRYPEATLYMLDWPLSTVRVESKDKKTVENLSIEIFDHWKDYSDENLGILAETTEAHNTIMPVARRGEGGTYIMNLILRNNRTDERYPDGIFNTHKIHRHLIKENIGLIEAMGLAVLSSTLWEQIGDMSYQLIGMKDHDYEKIHKKWLDEIIDIFGDNMTKEGADGALKLMIPEKFSDILDNCGVFKKTEEGKQGFLRFVEEIGCIEKAKVR